MVVLAGLMVMVLALAPAVASAQGGLEFTDWTASAGNVATGSLLGHAVTLSGTYVSPAPYSIVDERSDVFSSAALTPPLPLSDAIEFRAAKGGYSFTLSFGAPVPDPVIHLASLGSKIDFAPGTVITRVSGDPAFTVSGSSVVGDSPTGDHANGTIRLNGTYTTITFTASPTTYPDVIDGIYIEVGATPSATGGGGGGGGGGPPPPPPDISLTYGPGHTSGSVLAVAPGGQATLPVAVMRNTTSTGRVQLSATGLPAGVTARFSPAEVDGRDADSTLTLRATTTAAPIRKPITIIATPLDVSAGPAPRSLLADLLVQGSLAVNVQGIEVTQAVQTYDQPRFQGYHGVPLVQGKKTVVRVFADLLGNEPKRGGARPPVGMALFATDSTGRKKLGSPLFPVWAPGAAELPLNESYLTSAERNSATSAFTFVLPDAWTRGPLKLEARALGSSTVGGRPAGSTLCLSTACGATPTRTLGGITFRHAPAPADLSLLNQVVVLHANHNVPSVDANGNPTTISLPDPEGKILGLSAVKASPDEIFEKLLALSPVPFRFFDAEGRAAPWPRFRGARFASNAAIWEPADAYDEEIGRPGLATVGVFSLGDNPGVTIGHTSVVSGRTLDDGTMWRPATSVAHEIFHQLGFQHASPDCMSGGEPWPVPHGRMGSVGIDTTPGSGGSDAPYRIIADTDDDPAYDLMSYYGITCGPAASEGRYWISAYNWTRALGLTPPAPKSARLIAPTLSVRAQIIAGSVKILAVTPISGRVPLGPGPSPYRLVARDGSGRTLTTAPVFQSVGSGAAGVAPVITLEAYVPSAGVGRVELLGPGGRVVASRVASRSTPAARFLSPRRRQVVGASGSVVVRWKASDPDGDALTAVVDVSSDGGRTFHDVWAGPARPGSVQLPSELLDATDKAELRLRLNDGFRETTVKSTRFIIAARRPHVTIVEPGAGARVASGGAVFLRGFAVDDRGRQVTGRRLVWRAGRTVLGRGTDVSAVLPAGTRAVRLDATDAARRTASDSVKTNVRASTPFFLRLSAPSVSRRARAVVLVVAATEASSLAVGGRRYSVDTDMRRVRVPIKPGRTALRFRLTLAAGGRRSASTVVVNRR